jgi:hypothetical protein
MCFSSQITRATPSARYAANASAGCSSRSGRAEVATGAIVGGRYSSRAGSIANRLITSSAPAAWSSRTVIRPWWAVSTTRLPSTSSMSSRSAARAGGANGLTGSYQTRCAATATTSRSG